jgi:hypothetical protein
MRQSAAHGEYENTQLEKSQKIEVHEIFLILFIAYRGTAAPTTVSKLANQGKFLFVSQYFHRVRKFRFRKY